MKARASLLALALAACTAPATRTAEAVDEVRAELATRLGVAPPAWSADAPGADVDGEVAALLAEELTESAAVRIALLNNRDVRAGYERLGIGAAELVQGGLLRNPVFGVESLFFFAGGTEVDLGLTASFLDLFWRPLRARAAEHELASARARVTAELVRLAYSVRRELARLHAARQLVELQRRSLAAAQGAHELMRTLHAAGNVTDRQLTAERVGEARARLELAAAERAELEAREPLNRLLGLWGEQVRWRSHGALPADPGVGLDLDADLEAAGVAQSLALQANRARIERAAVLAGLTAWERLLPASELGGGARREAGGEWGMGPIAALELPLFDQGQARAAGAAAALRLHLLRHVQLGVEVRSAARLLRDRLRLLTARLAFERDELLPAAAGLVRQTAHDFNAMQIGAFDVLQQQRRLLAAERDHLATLRDAWLARLDLEELLAGSLPAASLDTFWPEATGSESPLDRGGH